MRGAVSPGTAALDERQRERRGSRAQAGHGGMRQNRRGVRAGGGGAEAAGALNWPLDTGGDREPGQLPLEADKFERADVVTARIVLVLDLEHEPARRREGGAPQPFPEAGETV